MIWLIWLAVIFVLLSYLPVGAYIMGRFEGRKYDESMDWVLVWFWPVFVLFIHGGRCLSRWFWNKGINR